MKLKFKVHSESIQPRVRKVKMGEQEVEAMVPHHVVELVSVGHSETAGSLKLELTTRDPMFQEGAVLEFTLAPFKEVPKAEEEAES